MLDKDFYVRDFTEVKDEVLDHLSSIAGGTLEVRLEIPATAPDGFDEGKIRTVGENAGVLRFEQWGFEES